MKKQQILTVLLSCGLLLTPQAKGLAKDINWGIPKSKDGEQPHPGSEYDRIIQENDAYYIGEATDNAIYLTFDAGFENGNMPMILDALKKEKVPALFFLTGHFLEKNPDLVKRMVDEGHLVGNHTYYHPNLTRVTKEEFNEELTRLEDKYREITGLEMVKFLRPPEGSFNQEMLDWAKERDYYTIMWSLAYVDWDVNDQKGGQHAYNEILPRIHPGAIILLHSTSSDNAECLDKLIPKLKSEGYDFKSLQYLISRDLVEPLA